MASTVAVSRLLRVFPFVQMNPAPLAPSLVAASVCAGYQAFPEARRNAPPHIPEERVKPAAKPPSSGHEAVAMTNQRRAGPGICPSKRGSGWGNALGWSAVTPAWRELACKAEAGTIFPSW